MGESFRESALRRCRQSVVDEFAQLESETGLSINLEPLSLSSEVNATYTFDPQQNSATIHLSQSKWEDVDLAHELTHMRMELVEGFGVVAWRRSATRSPYFKAVNAKIRAFIDDEVVHNRLFKSGFRLDGEIIRPQLFDDRCVVVPARLKAAKSLKNDGMSHFDSVGCGDLYRALLYMQCKLLRKNRGEELSPARTLVLDDFIGSFERYRPKQTRKAARFIQIVEGCDIGVPSGHSQILSELISCEAANEEMGISVYKRENGRFSLPWP